MYWDSKYDVKEYVKKELKIVKDLYHNDENGDQIGNLASKFETVLLMLFQTAKIQDIEREEQVKKEEAYKLKEKDNSKL